MTKNFFGNYAQTKVFSPLDIESVQGPRITMELSYSSVVETGVLVIVPLSRVFIKSENWGKKQLSGIFEK